MASGPITSWKIEGGKVEIMKDFILGGSQITTDSGCNHEIKKKKKVLAPWKESYDQPRQHIKKQRHHFANKGPCSQSYGFFSGHVWMWELDHKEDWALMNDAFELWFWRRLLRVFWTTRKSNPSILKEINPEYSLEGLMLKLKLQYSGHLVWRADPLQKTLILGKIEGRRRRKYRIKWLDSVTNSSVSKLLEIVKDKEVWCAAVHGITKSWPWLSN